MVTEEEAKASLDTMAKNMIEKEKEEAGYTKNNIRINAMAQEIINTATIKSMRDNDEMWFYHTKLGYYTKDAESFIASKCASDISVNDKIGKVTDVVRGLTYRNREDFEQPVGMLNLANGVLDLRTMQLLPWSHEYNFKGRLEVAYTPGAECPTFKNLIEFALPNHEDRGRLQKIFGYCLDIENMKEEVGFFIVGKTGSSKSTIIRAALIPLLGKGNITNYALQAFDEDSYSIAALYGKIANICLDMGTQIIKNVDKFKQLTGQDYMTGRNIYSPPFSFMNKSKLIFVCNKLPRLRQQVEFDEAFWRRVIIIPFLIKHTETDKDLDAKIMAELPGILNWAVEGLHELWRIGFDYNIDPYDVWMSDVEENNPINNFFSENFEIGDSNYVVVDDAWKAYLKFCDDENKKPLKQRMFGNAMYSLGAEKTSRHLPQPDNTTKNTAIYGGICWKADRQPEAIDHRKVFSDPLKLVEYIKSVILVDWNFSGVPKDKNEGGYNNLYHEIALKVKLDSTQLESAIDTAFRELFPTT